MDPGEDSLAGAQISPLAGKTLGPDMLIDASRLVDAYYDVVPDPSRAAQRVRFGTSGHRGSAFHGAFNEAHVLAIAQAICLYRERSRIHGPLFLGFDTHALSRHAFATAVEVFAANGVTTLVDARDDYTPTPAISHAILAHNRRGVGGLADGVVLTPSHNPPEDGGFKYNPPSGGPADLDVTRWIETTANGCLDHGPEGVRRMPFGRACASANVRRYDYLAHYVEDLPNLIDLEAIRAAGVRIGIDPLGGAGVRYWPSIIERYGLDGTIVEAAVDPTFGFMTADWDGKIRMDCSSPYAMARLIELRDGFDLAIANDTDADRHGIVTPSHGLEPPNHYLAAAIAYLFGHRPLWGSGCRVGKTMVSSSMIDRVTSRAGRQLEEVPVGFKWFVGGLRSGVLAFAGEESAGASFLRQDGSVWTTDKDGLALGLLAAEMLARTGSDPGQAYDALAVELGETHYARIDAPATPEQMDRLRCVSPEQLPATDLAGEPIAAMLVAAPGGGAGLGGVKVTARSGWFAARPSGTEQSCKIYAESFRSPEHLRAIQEAAQALLGDLFATSGAELGSAVRANGKAS